MGATTASSTPQIERDPVSELLDAGARRLLERAYAKPGQWVNTRLADPPPDAVQRFAAAGINLMGPDDAPTRGGTAKLRVYTRWGRGFVRALYYQHKWYSNTGNRGFRPGKRMVARKAGALQVEFGRRLPAAGVIPAGRAVRVRLMPGGRQALAAVRQLPDSQRTFTDAGDHAGASSELAGRRDW